MKVTVNIHDSFYENAKNYLQTLMKFEQGKEHKTHAEPSERDISTKTERMDSKGRRNCYRK